MQAKTLLYASAQAVYLLTKGVTMSNMSKYELEYAAAVARNPSLTAIEWEAIALASLKARGVAA